MDRSNVQGSYIPKSIKQITRDPLQKKTNTENTIKQIINHHVLVKLQFQYWIAKSDYMVEGAIKFLVRKKIKKREEDSYWETIDTQGMNDQL